MPWFLLLRIATIKSYEDSHLSANSESDVGRKIRILPAICDMSSKKNPCQVLNSQILSSSDEPENLYNERH